MNSSSKIKFIAATVLAVAMIFIIVEAVRGQETTSTEANALQSQVDAKKKHIDEIKAQIEAYNRDLAEKRKESASLQTQLGILENRVAKVELDIEAAEEEIASAELLIDSLTASVNEKTRDIEARKEKVGEYLRQIGRRADASDLEILLTHDNLSDYFDEVNSFSQLDEALTRTTQNIAATKAALEQQRAAQEVKKTELAALQKKLEESRTELNERAGEKEALYVASQESEAALRRDLVRLRAEERKTDNEITSLENSLRRKLKSNKQFQNIAGDGALAWPVPLSGITTYFHDPDYPFRYIFEHPAVDLRAPQGSVVRAAGPGFVARVKDGGTRGYSFLMIIHQNGISTVYGHVSQFLVKEDDFVERGQAVALSGGLPGTRGAGPLTTGPHLHFEVRLNGIPVNPLEYLSQ